MNPKTHKYSRAEIAVHLFAGINSHLPDSLSGSPKTNHTEGYTKEHESIMMGRYLDRLQAISDDPDALFVFVAHSRILAGELPDNARNVYMQMTELMQGRYFTFQSMISPDLVRDHIRPRLRHDAQIHAWGEFSSGCVLSDLINVHHGLGRDISYDGMLGCLVADCGVDFDGGYPRPWEDLSEQDKVTRRLRYESNVKANIEYALGICDMPAFRYA